MMNYKGVQGKDLNWIIGEDHFDQRFQGKCEAAFSLGNGYLGIRSATEEKYIDQKRNLFVAGTFNKSNENEVTELPNAADCIGIDFYLNGELFSLATGKYSNYNRNLNLRTGELSRSFEWEDGHGNAFSFLFLRMVSMADLHLFATNVSITLLKGKGQLRFYSGIDGQQTNSGAQHFEEGEKRIFDGSFIQMTQKTNESKIDFIHTSCHDFSDTDYRVSNRFEMDRRRVGIQYDCQLEINKEFHFSKISNIYTSRDSDVAHLDVGQIKIYSLERIKGQLAKSYDQLLTDSSTTWNAFWNEMDIKIESKDDFDQLAIRFAQYHLMIMTPRHDSRYGIAAKGLSGEGYKGHSFWDTEIFILPFFTYTFPEMARSLLEYRFHTLVGARNKAIENGYKGAMYPWESAWAADGEVTPVWGAADIISGESTKIWSGFIEQHITSDIAFAVWQYYQITGDEDFMKLYGYEIILDTGIFWASRLEWNEEKKEYHINNVVGPDEYKEHVNNDAFTNYTAKWCIDNALNFGDTIKEKYPRLYAELNAKLFLDSELPILKEKVNSIYIPNANSEGVIPQDDSYLSKKQIDLTKYKDQDHVGSIYKDYNQDQINSIQVSKQASVVMLMYLLEHLFSSEIKEANYNYYEPRTLHDSSLSLSTHAVLASDLGDTELAYNLFKQAASIDLGQNMKSSDHGIHAASFGGVWQIIVCGFGGMRMLDGQLRLNPNLPENINSISYPIHWQGNLLRIHITNGSLNIQSDSDEMIRVSVQGEKHAFQKSLALSLSSTTVI